MEETTIAQIWLEDSQFAGVRNGYLLICNDPDGQETMVLSADCHEIFVRADG